MDHEMLTVAASVLSAIASAAVGILAYMLREKNEKLKQLEGKVGAVEIELAVQKEANRYRDEKLERLDTKLDRILDKLGA